MADAIEIVIKRRRPTAERTVEVDVCVFDAGISGVSPAVEAARLGGQVVLAIDAARYVDASGDAALIWQAGLRGSRALGAASGRARLLHPAKLHGAAEAEPPA